MDRFSQRPPPSDPNPAFLTSAIIHFLLPAPLQKLVGGDFFDFWGGKFGGNFAGFSGPANQRLKNFGDRDRKKGSLRKESFPPEGSKISGIGTGKRGHCERSLFHWRNL